MDCCDAILVALMLLPFVVIATWGLSYSAGMDAAERDLKKKPRLPWRRP